MILAFSIFLYFIELRIENSKRSCNKLTPTKYENMQASNSFIKRLAKLTLSSAADIMLTLLSIESVFCITAELSGKDTKA